MKKVLEAIQAALKALADSKDTSPRAESIRAHLASCESNAAATLADAKAAGGFATRPVLMLVTVIALLGAFAMQARSQSFQITNRLTTGIVIGRTIPVNPAGIEQGSSVEVKNNEWVGIYFTGHSGVTNTTVDVSFVRGYGDSPAPYIYDAGTTNIIGQTWESASVMTWRATIATTGAFGAFTNLPADWVRGANYIGILTITNNAGSTLSNTVMGVTKKIIPTRWP